ncbi:hypothetical protein HY030_03010, partial [Candidatus Gottesmanbacteria bacterium]|nr:hypothetical protein [Candidatus Gottesmanbacteria bacterium]
HDMFQDNDVIAASKKINSRINVFSTREMSADLDYESTMQVTRGELMFLSSTAKSTQLARLEEFSLERTIDTVCLIANKRKLYAPALAVISELEKFKVVDYLSEKPVIAMEMATLIKGVITNEPSPNDIDRCSDIVKILPSEFNVVADLIASTISPALQVRDTSLYIAEVIDKLMLSDSVFGLNHKELLKILKFIESNANNDHSVQQVLARKLNEFVKKKVNISGIRDTLEYIVVGRTDNEASNQARLLVDFIGRQKENYSVLLEELWNTGSPVWQKLFDLMDRGDQAWLVEKLRGGFNIEQLPDNILVKHIYKKRPDLALSSLRNHYPKDNDLAELRGYIREICEIDPAEVLKRSESLLKMSVVDSQLLRQAADNFAKGKANLTWNEVESLGDNILNSSRVLPELANRIFLKLIKNQKIRLEVRRKIIEKFDLERTLLVFSPNEIRYLLKNPQIVYRKKTGIIKKATWINK